MRPLNSRTTTALAAASLLVAAFCAGCAGSHRTVDHVQARSTDEGRDERAEEGPAAAPSTPAAQPVYHTVQPGQTIWRIANTYGLTVDELARANGIADPSRVAAGDRLRIPGASTPREVPAAPAAGGTLARADEWIWPVGDGAVLSYFGAPRRTHRHAGIDIRGKTGERVRASRSGVVVYSGASMRGYGKTVILDHGDGHRSLYAHNSKLLVRNGEQVRRGQSIARVGRSGNASTEHCHFEIRRNNVAVDPMRYVSPSSGGRP